MSFLSMFNGGQEKGYKDLEQEMEKGRQAREQYFKQASNQMTPYADAGKNELNQYQNYLANMQGMMNPTLFGNTTQNTQGQNTMQPGNWMAGYKQSPYAKFQTHEELNAANNAASASGMLGSSANQENNMKIAQNISSGDMQNYFNNMFREQGLYQQGMQNLSNMGYGAASSMGNWAMNTGNAMDNDYENEGAAHANADMAHQNAITNLISGAASIGRYL